MSAKPHRQPGQEKQHKDSGDVWEGRRERSKRIKHAGKNKQRQGKERGPPGKVFEPIERKGVFLVKFGHGHRIGRESSSMECS